MSLADEFDGFLVDLDGVVWIGREPVPGSARALAELLAAGKQLAFVTNNPARSPAAYAARLAELGVAVGPERVVTAGVATSRLAAEAAGPGGSAYVIGAPAFREMVAAALGEEEGDGGGVEAGEATPKLRGAARAASEGAGEGAGAAEEADVVVVSGHRGFDYEELLTATQALRRGADLLATSRDPTLPMPGGAWPGTGSVLAAVETASGRRAKIGGKPEAPIFELALEAIGRPERVAMVGDRLASDVAGGAGVGLRTVLVGNSAERQRAATASPPPDHVLDDLAALLL